MKIARREFASLAAGVAQVPATLRTARWLANALQPVRIPVSDPKIRRSNNACQVRKMQKPSSLLFTTLISMSILAFVTESGAQNSRGTLAPKTRVVTLGTRGGPVPMMGRAQASNVLIVNGALYVVDAGEGVTRRLVRAGIAIRDIDNIFITHPHSDHTGGLGGLLSSEYDLYLP